MRLYERLGDSGFHTSIITTFGIDFDAYENIVLSRLRGAGCRNNIVLLDDRMLTHALSEALTMPREAGRQYSVCGVQSRGVFHPKLFLQFGRNRGRAIIASANATASGLAGNIELAGTLECTDVPSSAQQLIASVWKFVSSRLDRERRSLREQVAWMQARTPWLTHADPAKELLKLADGTLAAFLATSEPRGILERFLGVVGSDPVDQLIIVSPYWDEDLMALRELARRFDPKQTRLLIDASRGQFPGPAIAGLRGVQLIDLVPWNNERFVHAKLVIVRTGAADHVLYGSANCTVAALGRFGFVGKNDEACLYRRLPPNSAVEKLGLEKLLESGATLQADRLPPFIRQPEVGINELQRSPGRFECAYDVLTWFRPLGVKESDVTIVLFDRDGPPLHCELIPLGSDVEGISRFRMMNLREPPGFAQVHFDDTTSSSRAIISSVDALIGSAREPPTKHSERARRQLEEDTEIDLALLEVVNDLEAADQEAEARLRALQSRSRRGPAEQEVSHKILSYESFMAGRKIRADASEFGRDSLMGTEQSFVRVFLNRVLGLSGSQPDVDDKQSDERIDRLIDLGDEVSDAAGAVEGGASFITAKTGHVTEPSPAHNRENLCKTAAARRETQQQIAQAAEQLAERVKSHAESDCLTTRDLLRVRAVLTIIVAAGSDGREPSRSNDGIPLARSLRGVLPSSGSQHCWPRLLARCLYALFGGRSPSVQRLKIDATHDQLPDDLLECWATSYWAAQATRAANERASISPKFTESLQVLLQRLYVHTALAPQEALGEKVTEVMIKLGERFSQRLGISTTEIMELHRSSLMFYSRSM